MKRSRAMAALAWLLSVAATDGFASIHSPVSQHSNGKARPVNDAFNVLIAKAKAEKMVRGFGMPGYWANLDATWHAFSRRYGIRVYYEAYGDMSSGQELQAFYRQRRHPVGDVGDVGISFGPSAVKMGVVAPYKNRYWRQIPNSLKDPYGYWAAAYYGVTAFEIDTDLVKDVPHTWKDLLKPEYKGMIGFADPRVAAVSFAAVVAASYANGGNLHNLQPGLHYFKALYGSHNWSGADYSSAAMKAKQIAIGITWNYLGFEDSRRFGGKPHIIVVIPKDGVVAGPYIEVINKYAPHPYAARLFNEYLFSDAGQISYAEGGAYPVRLPFIRLPNHIHLPPLDMKHVHFLSGNLDGPQHVVDTLWPRVVLAH